MRKLAQSLVASALLLMTDAIAQGPCTTDQTLEVQPGDPGGPAGSSEAVPEDWIDKALGIVARFETGAANAWTATTGDFDGNGISLGALQFNIGQGSLQRLLRGLDETVILRYMPTNGREFSEALRSSVPQGLTVVRRWQITGGRQPVIRPEIVRELQALLASDEVMARQKGAVRRQGNVAYAWAEQWARDLRGSGSPSLREFVTFFDLFTFNDGTRGLWKKDIDAFKKTLPEGRSPAVFIADWLASCPDPMYGLADAKRNAADWRQGVPDDALDLFIFGYLRAVLSRGDKGKFKADVMNRRGTIAIGRGQVHMTYYKDLYR